MTAGDDPGTFCDIRLKSKSRRSLTFKDPQARFSLGLKPGLTHTVSDVVKLKPFNGHLPDSAEHRLSRIDHRQSVKPRSADTSEPQQRSWLIASELPATLLLLFITVMFSLASWVTLPSYSGIDFSQFWGVAAAASESGFTLGSPYREVGHYAAQFDHLMSGGGGPLFWQAIHFREKPDLTATPLLYAAFAILPSNYVLSFQIYRGLQLLAFSVSTWVLSRAATSNPIGRLGLTFLTVLAYSPLIFDLEVGNLNSLQLMAMIGLASITVAPPGGPVRLGTARLLAASSLITLLVLLKPNVGGSLAAFGISLLSRSSLKSVAFAGAAVIGTALLLFCLPIAYFHCDGIWVDWWQSTFRSVHRLSYPLEAGNCSASLYIATQLGLSTPLVMSLMGGLFVVSVGMAALWAWRRGHSLPALSDVYFWLGLGTLLTFATSPLMWPHYYILGLIPVFRLLGDGESWSLHRVLAILALLLMAGLPEKLQAVFGTMPHETLLPLQVFAWLPLWFGLLARLASLGDQAKAV
jgi:hypothetical protein